MRKFMGLSRRLLCLHFAATLFFLGLSRSYAAGPWDNAVAELAAKIMSHTAPHAEVSLEVRNQSSLDSGTGDEIARSLRVELRARGARVLKTSRPEEQVIVTLSENLQGLLWVAEIRRTSLAENAPEVVMLQVARPAAENPPSTAETLVLHKTFVYGQRDPILDLALLDPAGGGETRLLVLDAERVGLYARWENNWVIEQSLSLTRSRPWPRDPRGRLEVKSDGNFIAFTPGTRCQGTTSPLTLDCSDSNQAWTLSSREPAAISARLVPGRNYFDGKLTLGGKDLQMPMFFSTAAIPGSAGALIVLTGLDHRARVFGQKPAPLAALDGWGSDITSLQTGCGSGWQILATHAGGLTQPDSVQAFSLDGGTPAAASAPVVFPGPVTALWPAPSGRAALAVAHDPRAGDYEAFTLTVACGE
jgi:hypothetical protein